MFPICVRQCTRYVWCVFLCSRLSVKLVVKDRRQEAESASSQLLPLRQLRNPLSQIRNLSISCQIFVAKMPRGNPDVRKLTQTHNLSTQGPGHQKYVATFTSTSDVPIKMLVKCCFILCCLIIILLLYSMGSLLLFQDFNGRNMFPIEPAANR